MKDAVDCICWLSPTPWPKASNRRVLQAYSPSMRELMVEGYLPGLRPSGRSISDRFGTDNGGSIPPNLIALAHSESNSEYLRFCKAEGLKPHPARFPSALPEFFIRMLTDQGDLAVDPFAGSCATGEAADRTRRRWVCCGLEEDYLKGALGRFQLPKTTGQRPSPSKGTEPAYYRAYRPGSFWNGTPPEGRLETGGIRGPRRRGPG